MPSDFEAFSCLYMYVYVMAHCDVLFYLETCGRFLLSLQVGLFFIFLMFELNLMNSGLSTFLIPKVFCENWNLPNS